MPVTAPEPRRVRFVIALASVTVGAVIFAVAFRASLSWLYRTLYDRAGVVDSIAALSGWARLVPPIVAAGLAGAIGRFRPGPAQGVSNVMEAIALGQVRLSLRATVARVAASWAAIAGGVSIGREGPLIEVGGALGAGVGRRLELPLHDVRVLVAAGTAAGFAAAYNTPFAAALFVLECMVGIAAPALLLPVLAATIGSTGIARATIGAGPIYGQRAFGLDSNLDLVSFAALGAAAALLAAAFKRLLAAFEDGFERTAIPQPIRSMTGGAIVGIIVVWLPSVAGNGYETLNAILDRPMSVGALAVLVIAKMMATSGSVASGIPGGIFTPMLLVGAALGSGWSAVLGLDNPGSYALVGMAATTAASIHAPLTAAVLVFELSGDYLIVLPLLLATVVSTAVSRGIGTVSVYDAELRKRGLAWDMTLEGRQVRTPDGLSERPIEEEDRRC